MRGPVVLELLRKRLDRESSPSRSDEVRECSGGDEEDE